jgi:N4-gp56 family major capsid protein
MTQFQWQFDAPSGVFKNHALSADLYKASVEDSVFMDHVKPISEFGRKMGENITLKRVSSVAEPTSVDLLEGVRIPEDTLTLSTKGITVGEIGRAIPFSSFAEDLASLDIEGTVQSELRRQMKLALDSKVAAAMTGSNAKIKYVPTGLASATVTTNGTAGAAASANMNVYHAEEIRDYLYDTLQAEPAEGDDYIGIFRTLGIRGLKRDPDWEEWHKYTDPSVKFNSEVGRIESIRFVETNHANALGKIGTSSVLGEGVVFGKDYCAMAEAMTPELRAAIPGDFGRSKAVAWYGILAFDIIWDTGNAGQAKGVHVTST